MMDRARLASVPGLSEEQRSDAMAQAVEAASVFDDPRVEEAIRALRDSDPDLKVREKAYAVSGGPPGR